MKPNNLYVNVMLGFASSAPTYRPYLIPSITAKNWLCFMDEVVECLSAATNLSGTNLDVRDARRVSDRDVANQFSATP